MFPLAKFCDMLSLPRKIGGKPGGNSRNGDNKPIHPLHMPHGIQLF